MEVPGYSRPAHQYGEPPRDLDVTEAQELALWERDGFTGRNEESTT